MRKCLHSLIYSTEGVRTNTVCDKCVSVCTCEPPHAFMIIAFNGSLSVTHWHCPPEILPKMAWFTKPLEREKKSHWGDGLLRGLSSRPINHSLIRAHWEWGYTLRPHISTTDSQLSMVLLLHSAFQTPSVLLCPPSSLVLYALQYKAACHLPERNVDWYN